MIRFRRLRLERFRAFSERTLEFAPGLTVIRGRNEAGKSTLHAALRTVLFARPGSRARDLLAQRSWDHDSLFSLTLEFEHAGRPYRLSKDFEARRALLEDLQGGDAWRDPDTIQQILEDRLGLGPEGIYLRLCWLNHDDMLRLVDDRRAGNELLARLQASVVAMGSARSPDEALKLARDRLSELRRGLDRPALNPGPLRRLRDELADLDARIAERRRRWEQAQQAGDARRAAEEELTRVQARLAELDRLLAANRRIRELEQRRDALAQAYEQERSRLRRAREAAAARDAAAERLRRLKETQLPADEELTRLRRLADRVAALDESLAQRAEAAAGAPQPRPSSPLLLRLLAAALVVAGVLGAVLFDVRALALSAAGALLFAWSARRAGPAAPDPLEALGSQRALAAASLEEGLRRWGAPSLQALEQARREREAAESELRAAEQRIADILAGTTLEELDDRIDELRRDLREVEKDLHEHAAYRLDPATFAAYEGEAEGLLRRRAELEQRLRAAELEAARADVDPDELYALEETRDAVQARLRRLEDHAAALEILLEELEAARADLLAGVGARIADAVRPFLGTLTGDRYTDLTVDEGLAQVTVRRGDRPIPWEDLSRGTQDQLYFALRLGLIGLVYGDAAPPLLLDDPFLTFDDERAAHCTRLLRQLAGAGRQVILFTYSERYQGDAEILL